MKAFLCKLLFSCTLAGPGAKPIDELTYGTVLYDYFQEDYAAALVTTMVAERQARRGEDVVRFELAAGSFAFQHGLYGLATETFSAINATELTEIDQLRLAFHLAREYHRRGDWPALREQLALIDLGKRWWGSMRTHPEVEYMRAELAAVDLKFDDAYQLLSTLDRDDTLKAYGLFNLGVSLRSVEQAADIVGAVSAYDVFSELSELPAKNAETFDLVQRGKLALAYLARARDEQRSAAQVLEELPINGRYRNTALAAYGNLAMAEGEFELAARVWLTLKQEPYWTPSTAAARLGFPLSLENLASREMALAQYRRAEATFVSRLSALDELQQRLSDRSWVQSLIATFSLEQGLASSNGLAALEQWRSELGHTDWLEWLATEEVNELLEDWRSLRNEQQWLGEMPDALAALEQVSLEQQRRRQQARQVLVVEDRLGERERQAAWLDAMDTRLKLLAAEAPRLDWDWMHELGTPDERALISELETKARLVETHFQDAEAQRWLARIARLQGVLLWEQTVTHATRLQRRRTELMANRELLASLDDSIDRLNLAEETFTATVALDFARLLEETDRLSNAVAAALIDREERLAYELREGVRREMAQVQRYLLTARVAIARTTDQLAGAGLFEAPEQELAE